MIESIKSWLLHKHFILCEKTSISHEALCRTEVLWLPQGKATSWLFLCGELNSLLFSTWRHCSLKEQSCSNLCVCFWKMNEISLSLQVKQWTVFIGSDKILALQWKLEFLEHLSPPPFPPIKEVLFCIILVDGDMKIYPPLSRNGDLKPIRLVVAHLKTPFLFSNPMISFDFLI